MSITPTPRMTGVAPLDPPPIDLSAVAKSLTSPDGILMKGDSISNSAADPYVHLGSLSVAKDGYGDFQKAEHYLSRDREARTMLQQLEHAKHPVTLDIDYGPPIRGLGQNSYDSATHTIDWDAGLGFKVSGNQSVSPALVLLHEEAHAVGDAYAPKHTAKLHATLDVTYDDLEEKRVITGPESRAATTLGEGHRTSHDSNFWFTTSDPTSRR